MELNGRTYSDVNLTLLDDLCAPVLLGHDFLKQHQSVSLEFGGKLPSLSVCGLIAASIDPPSLFSDLSPDCTPIQTKSRRHSEADEDFIDKEVARLLLEGVIVPSRSPWRAQVLVVPQGDKKRLVVDYAQTINRFTRLNAYPLPSITEMVEKISKYKVFSSIDLRSAYHQIPILEDEQKFTAFEASGQLFQFTRVPFGVTNGVACFQQVINDVIRAENLHSTYAYVDDITICGHSQEDHDTNLERFLRAAEKYGLTLNEGKCKFNQSSITILGHVIKKQEISPDPERMRPLLEMPAPCDANSLKRALGLLSYYSKWVSRFSEKLRPILDCKVFPLTSDAVTAFERLKTEISQASLHGIEDGVPFRVETDASAEGLAATLSQAGRPIAFFSRGLSSAERHHSSMEKEACAIVEAVRKWRHFLLGKHFVILTDQQAVRFMFDGKNKGKIKNEKILRWRLELSSFDFDISYREGRQNVVADALSRIPFASDCVAAVSDDDLVMLHDALCHPGVTRLWHAVRARNLPFSLDDVKMVLRRCRTCSEIKPKFVKRQGTLIKATRPFERLNVDFKGPLPSSSKNRFLFVVVDEYSRFPFAYPTRDVSAETALSCLYSLFSIFGLPDSIHSDRGSAFTSEMYQRALHERGVATNFSSAYNPRGNGQVERYNGVLWKNIQLALHARKLPVERWETVLSAALHSLRSLLCTATNKTPHERLFSFPRKATFGKSMPSWLLTSRSVLLRRPVMQSKYESLTETVELVHTNPEYARVKHADGHESTVSLRRLAPMGGDVAANDRELDEASGPTVEEPAEEPAGEQQLRRSTRIRSAPDRYDLSSYL
jgi:transposase InsO family protein